MDNLIEIKKLGKEYKDATGYTNLLFTDLNLKIVEKKITALLAPAGSGKSSLLKILAGLESQTSGEISSGNVTINYIPSDSSIFPWLDVKGNITYNLKNVPESDVTNTIEFVGLDGYEDHIPHPKSKGFQLRVALARAIVRKPDLIVLDEPFDAIKPAARQSLVQLVIRMNNELGFTILLTSSNINRAILVSDKLIVMRKNPGQVVGQFDVSFNTRRTPELYKSEEFISLKSKVDDTIKSISDLHEYEFTM